MDFDRAARILNMDLTGVDPGPPSSHVRLLNAPDEHVSEDEFGQCWAEMPDIHDDSTDTNRSFVVEIHFDAPTDLEASLATSAISGFVRRRLTLDNVVVIGRANQTVG